MTQLPERLGLDLADALARYPEALAHFLQRVLAVGADPEAEPPDLPLLRGEHGQRTPYPDPEVRGQERLVGRGFGLVLQEVPELGVLADGRLERQRLPRGLQDEPHLPGRDPGPPGQVLRRGPAAPPAGPVPA